MYFYISERFTMNIVQIDQPMAGYLRRYAVTWEGSRADYNVFSHEAQPVIIAHCQQLIHHDLQSFKLHVRVKVNFHKVLDASETCDAFFSNRQSTILPATNIAEEVELILGQIAIRIEEFCENGSDWTIAEIKNCDLHIARYQPINGAASTFMELPTFLSKKRAVINVCNEDNQCFKWAV